MRPSQLVPAIAALALACGDPTGPNPREVHAVVSGLGFSCALVGENVYCWGRNDMGQLGRGATGSDAGPGLVTGDHHFRLLAASERTVCGVTTDGAVFCWGHGRLFGAADPVPTPTAMAGIFPSSIASIGVGYSHACVLSTAGAAACFGTNSFGEVGNGTTQSTGATQAGPVIGGHTFSQLSVGGFHTCGIKAGAPWCWGGNFAASFGPGSENQQSFPSPTLIGLSFAATRVDLGPAVTCVLDASSKAWCWGSNLAGQLGRGVGTASLSSAVPTAVSQASTLSMVALPNINSVIAHSCSIATNGSASCWGLNDASQLGRVATESCAAGGQQSTYPCSAAPAAVETTLSFKQLSLGRDHTCGLTTQGEIYCWGTDARRQLGGGVGGPSTTPVRVTIPE